MSRMHTLERVGSPGLYLVDFLPILMYLPEWLAPFKQQAKKLHEIESSYFYSLFREAEDKYRNAIAEDPPSFARQWLSKDDGYGLTWKEACYVVATLYGGGSGTTSLTMQNYCLAVCHFPEWQERLHDEVEKVVGPGRVPEFTDWGQLPLVRAFAKELLRWRPVVPSNLPHRAVKSDVYQGYYIPKGSLVWGNQWGMHRNEAMYPNGDSFCPDRWLRPEYPATYKEPNEQQPTIRRYSAFGFGRRICPGYEIAERALFIQIASLAWACRICKKIKDGKEVEVPWYKYVSAGNSGPEPFEFDTEPYGENRIAMMKEAWKRSEV
ncbi:hypothetical protein H2204_008835 [Knufia peltigerae]|uniref:Cytochrome P450 n=1 Tax=Knufia peltigerae TaxID=1002370 RepID=A0AA39CWJ3_9EURO|nr:hypothetical protein H2204_008835 [Knufia peltigerae]